jgi:hypothetical protein
MATGRVPTTANSPLTAKGDLFGYSTTQARVAVGNDGETLVADSSTTTGLRYTAGTVQANPVLNSAFQIWQRGTSGSATTGNGSYVADRWSGLLIGATPTNTITRQVTGDTTNLPFIQYCARYQRTSGQTATGTMYLTQSMESINSIPFAGKTVTLSFYARRGANYSATSNLLGVDMNSGTGTDQNINAGFTGSASVIASSVTLTTTWQRFTITGTVPSTSNQLGFYFYYSPTGTAGAADFFEVTGVQIDAGSVALPFRTYAGTIQGELAACQRYYVRIGGSTAYETIGLGFGWSSTRAGIQVKLPTTMRIAPSSLDFALPMDLSDSATGYAVTTASITNTGKDVAVVRADVSSGLTQYRPYSLTTNNSTSAYVGFSAEL